jgi:hypothetical protein
MPDLSVSAARWNVVGSVRPVCDYATWMKSTAVLVCIAGVVMVSTAPSSNVAASVTVSAVGYVYLMVSVITYALYEVRTAL